MRVESLQLQGFRSFANTDPIELGAINVFIGANNAGKSSILRALYLLQDGSGSAHPDVRAGMGSACITLRLTDISGVDRWGSVGNIGHGLLKINIASSDRRGGSVERLMKHPEGNPVTVPQLPAMEPHHFVVPYLSKRKTAAYQQDVRNDYAMQVVSTMSFLAAKLSRICNPTFPGHERYAETCKAILGFMVTAVPADNGQQPGIYLPNKEIMPIDQMGEGVPNIVALLADLALSENKLFLIEEPENDLHPKALKALLDLIIESSKSNQFVISTHSNIVVRHLGGGEANRLYSVSTVPGQLPTEAAVSLVASTPQARLAVLRDLGYSFSDFDLWDGWLILEESSAERIIRDYLIPWFAPKLSRVRTLAVGGTGQVVPTFDDFHRMVRFTHLEQAYTNAAWVRIDGDATGKKIAKQLQERYPTWESDRFGYFSNEQFESYFPAEFQDKVTEVLSISDKQDRRNAKRLLLEEVRAWLDADSERGRTALLQSATEVIADLQAIENQLLAR